LSSLGRAPARISVPPPEPPPETGTVRRWLHGALFNNVGLKFLSMVLAITVFLLVNTDRDREMSARVRVSYSLPDGMSLESDQVEEVRVILKGSWRKLRALDETKIDPISLDLRHAPSGDIAITADMIHLPAGLTIESITPRTVHVAFDRSIEKVVEIAPQVQGSTQHGYAVAEMKAVPATIKVRGAERTLGALLSVQTLKISVENRAESFVAETEAVPPKGVELVGAPQVLVHVTVEEELVSRKLPGLVVGVRGDNVDPAKWAVSPPQIEVTLTGALLEVEKTKAALVPVVKLSASDTKPREVEVTVEGVSPGIGVKLSPERVKVTPVK
jgi:YbbR domain-containing protein